MSWGIKHSLFGWDYVYIENSVTGRICRVKITPAGQRYFQPYSFQINILPTPIPITGTVINGWKVTALTPNITTNPAIENEA